MYIYFLLLSASNPCIAASRTESNEFDSSVLQDGAGKLQNKIDSQILSFAPAGGSLSRKFIHCSGLRLLLPCRNKELSFCFRFVFVCKPYLAVVLCATSLPDTPRQNANKQAVPFPRYLMVVVVVVVILVVVVHSHVERAQQVKISYIFELPADGVSFLSASSFRFFSLGRCGLRLMKEVRVTESVHPSLAGSGTSSRRTMGALVVSGTYQFAAFLFLFVNVSHFPNLLHGRTSLPDRRALH